MSSAAVVIGALRVKRAQNGNKAVSKLRYSFTCAGDLI